jgi:hypothetical protein
MQVFIGVVGSKASYRVSVASENQRIRIRQFADAPAPKDGPIQNTWRYRVAGQ